MATIEERLKKLSPKFVDVPPGEWSIGPAPVRWESETARLAGVASVAERLVVPAGTADVNVAIEAHRGLFLQGEVLDPAGAPVDVRARVSAQLVDSPRIRFDATTRDAKFLARSRESWWTPRRVPPCVAA